jgi:hypothetical protein
MKKQSGAIETHDLRQRRYPMPGTELGTTTAIPYNEAWDVDAPGDTKSFVIGKRPGTLMPAENPTRR